MEIRVFTSLLISPIAASLATDFAGDSIHADSQEHVDPCASLALLRPEVHGVRFAE